MLDNNFKINPLAAFVKSTSNIIKAKYTLIDNLNKIEVNSKYWFSLCKIAENTLVAKWTRRWFPKPEIGGSNPSRGNQMPDAYVKPKTKSNLYDEIRIRIGQVMKCNVQLFKQSEINQYSLIFLFSFILQ